MAKNGLPRIGLPLASEDDTNLVDEFSSDRYLPSSPTDLHRFSQPPNRIRPLSGPRPGPVHCQIESGRWAKGDSPRCRPLLPMAVCLIHPPTNTNTRRIPKSSGPQSGLASVTYSSNVNIWATPAVKLVASNAIHGSTITTSDLDHPADGGRRIDLMFERGLRQFHLYLPDRCLSGGFGGAWITRIVACAEVYFIHDQMSIFSVMHPVANANSAMEIAVQGQPLFGRDDITNSAAPVSQRKRSCFVGPNMLPQNASDVDALTAMFFGRPRSQRSVRRLTQGVSYRSSADVSACSKPCLNGANPRRSLSTQSNVQN